MRDLDLGTPGNCLSCSKPRDYVVGESCLDCRVHYGTATRAQRTAYDYGRQRYAEGYNAGVIIGNLTERTDA